MTKAQLEYAKQLDEKINYLKNIDFNIKDAGNYLEANVMLNNSKVPILLRSDIFTSKEISTLIESINNLIKAKLSEKQMEFDNFTVTNKKAGR